jgi:hypothetical protein
MATVDRRGASLSAADPPISTNPNPDLAWKAPVRVATTGVNIALSGLQTIDGIALAAGDRVLVKDQNDAATNGLYSAQTGPWTRTIDALNNSQWAQGVQVAVTQGSANAGAAYQLTAANPVILGTSALSFVRGPVGINDASTVVPGLAQFYFPTYFGNPGSAIVSKVNRLQVGEAALTSADVLTPTLLPTTPSWADTLINANFIGSGQLSVVAAWGNGPLNAATRASDFTTAFPGQVSGGSGCNFMGVNDVPSATGNAIVYGLNAFGIRKSGVAGITFGIQADINVAGSVVDLNPYGTITGGVTFAAMFTSGAYSAVAASNATAGILIGQGFPTGPRLRKGILVMSPALDTSVGAGGAGVAMEVPRNASFRAINSLGSTDAEWWGNASGWNFSGGLTGTGFAVDGSGNINGNQLSLGGHSFALFDSNNFFIGNRLGTGFALVADSNPNNAYRATVHFFQNPSGATTYGQFAASGGFSVGTTSDPGAGAIYVNNAAFLIRTKTSFANGAGAQTATLTNAPAAGNPTKWIAVDDNGTTRQIPAW